MYQKKTWQYFYSTMLSSLSAHIIRHRQGQQCKAAPAPFFFFLFTLVFSRSHPFNTVSVQTWLVARILRLKGSSKCHAGSSQLCRTMIHTAWRAGRKKKKREKKREYFCSTYVMTRMYRMVNDDKLARNWPMSSDVLVMWLKLHALSGRGNKPPQCQRSLPHVECLVCHAVQDLWACLVFIHLSFLKVTKPN